MDIIVENKNSGVTISIDKEKFIESYLNNYASSDCNIVDKEKFIELMSKAMPIVMNTSEFWDRLESEAGVYKSGVIMFEEDR